MGHGTAKVGQAESGSSSCTGGPGHLQGKRQQQQEACAFPQKCWGKGGGLFSPPTTQLVFPWVERTPAGRWLQKSTVASRHARTLPGAPAAAGRQPMSRLQSRLADGALQRNSPPPPHLHKKPWSLPALAFPAENKGFTHGTQGLLIQPPTDTGWVGSWARQKLPSVLLLLLSGLSLPF